jgi:hypothetical protein
VDLEGKWEGVMSHLDKIIGISALVAGLFTMGGMLSTDAYLHGAQAEASGYDALTHLMVQDSNKSSRTDATLDVPAVATSQASAQ